MRYKMNKEAKSAKDFKEKLIQAHLNIMEDKRTEDVKTEQEMLDLGKQITKEVMVTDIDGCINYIMGGISMELISRAFIDKLTGDKDKDKSCPFEDLLDMLK